MNKNTETILVIGALAIGAYFLYRTVIEPIVGAEKAIGDVITNPGGAVTKMVGKDTSYIIMTPGYKQIEDVSKKYLPLKPNESVWFTPGWKIIGRVFGQDW